MLCAFHKQTWPLDSFKKKPVESPTGRYLVEYVCLDSCKTEPLAVDENNNDLIGRVFVGSGYKIPRDKLAQYNLKGHWETTKKGYRNFVIEDYEELVGNDEKSVLDFLQKRLPKVGPKTAQRMWDKFGKDVFDVIEFHPERLAEVKDLANPKKRMEVVNAYNEKKCIRNLHLLFASLGLSSRVADSVYNEYGANAEKEIKENPYGLVARHREITFAVADKIAMKNNLAPDSTERIKAACFEVLHQAESGGELFSETNGHLCVEANEFLQKVGILLARSYMLQYDYVRKSILDMCRNVKKPVFKLSGTNTVYVYNPKIAYMETQLAINICKLARRGFKNTFSIPEEIRLKEQEEGVALAPEQKAAVEVGLTNAFAVITGGPGTGKTTILKFIRDIYRKRNKNGTILLCSPTGVAATRMTASTGAEASTVHKALGLRPDDEGGGIFGEVPELDYDLIIVDETSMLDIFLSSAILRAVKDGARLIFIGDIDQLPSVGAGAVLRDIIESGSVPVVRLTKVYRQAEENKIAINAILTKNGKSSFDYKQGEFEFIPADSFADARTKMESLYLQEIAANGINNVMMLSPFRKKTESSVDSLNLLRDKVNPPDPKKAELEVGNKIFRVGDKVINLRNNDIASNGETGMIIQIDQKRFEQDDNVEIKKCITVDFGHDKRDYDAEEAFEMLDWAYAMTVHKSQGSEAKVVILNLMDGHARMLKRNLLYTAITRAKVRVYIVGTLTAIDKAVKSGVSMQDRRKTMLAQKIQYLMKLPDAQFSSLVKRFCR